MLRQAVAGGLGTWVVAGVIAFTPGAETGRLAAARVMTPSKDALTAGNLRDLHQLIRPQAGEFKWDAIPWYASIWHARQAAAAQDRPIFVFGTGGAGFNDPLGNC
jgi:hypothetical protein